MQDRTLVRLYVVHRHDVCVGIAPLGESTITDLTAERLLSRVTTYMTLHVAFLSAAVVTDTAEIAQTRERT